MEGGPKKAIENLQSPEEIASFNNVIFSLDSNGNWKSSAPNRKVIVLKGGVIPKAGEGYTVEIIEDTNPSDPTKGKMIGRIVQKVDSSELIKADGLTNDYEKVAHKGRQASRMLYRATGIEASNRDIISEDESFSLFEAQTEERVANDAMEKILDNPGVWSMLKFRKKNLIDAFRTEKSEKKKLDKYIKEETIILARNPDGVVGPDLRSLKKIREKIKEINREIEENYNKNPESHYGLHLRDLKKYQEQFTSGKIVETPYVRERVEEIIAHALSGQPILLYGHLGSGKTELAMHVARNYILKDRKDLSEKAAASLARWEATHPGAPDKEREKKRKQFEAEHAGALVISGSRYTSLSEFYGHQVLAIEGADQEEQEKKLQAFIEKVDDDYSVWETQNKNASEERKKQARDEIKSARLAQLEAQLAGGTASKFILGHVYQAMKEGRPVIIDEVNAIPHEVLISLNHILTRRPGDKITVQQNSGEEIIVKDGFVVIMTGNLNQNNARYVDRQDLDPAFLSRLHKMEYDYLPQEKLGDNPALNAEKNELYHLIVTRLLDRNGGLEIPQNDLPKLWELAKAARLIQDVFSGKEITGANFRIGGGPSAGVDARAILTESVLSLRAISAILGQYERGGYKYQLDYYIWNEFIGQSTKPVEKAYLYQLLRTQFGFFSDPGWPAADFTTTPADSFNINRPPKIEAKKTELLSPRQVIDLIFGKGPARTKWPETKLSKEEKTKMIKDAAEAAANAIAGGVDQNTEVPGAQPESGPKNWQSPDGKIFEIGKPYLNPTTKQKIMIKEVHNGAPVWVTVA